MIVPSPVPVPCVANSTMRYQTFGFKTLFDQVMPVAPPAASWTMNLFAAVIEKHAAVAPAPLRSSIRWPAVAGNVPKRMYVMHDALTPAPPLVVSYCTRATSVDAVHRNLYDCVPCIACVLSNFTEPLVGCCTRSNAWPPVAELVVVTVVPVAVPSALLRRWPAIS